MNDVGKSLNITASQRDQLNAITNKIQDQYNAQYNKLGTLSADDRFARQQELDRQFMADWNKSAGNVLNRDQMSRYQQLNYQYGGFNSLYDPTVQTRLNLSLTADQQRALRENWDWNNQQLQQINTMAATDPTKATQLYNDYWTARQERFNKFLTPEQQKIWLQMVGDPYTFQPTFTTTPRK